MSDNLTNDQSNPNPIQSEQIESSSSNQTAQPEAQSSQTNQDQNAIRSETSTSQANSSIVGESNLGQVQSQVKDSNPISSQPEITISSQDGVSQTNPASNPDTVSSIPSSQSPSVAPAPIPTAKKFTSLSVNKRFLEKTSPNASPNLNAKTGSSSSSLTSLSNGSAGGIGSSGSAARSLTSSPAAQTRLSGSKISTIGNASGSNSMNSSRSPNSNETTSQKTNQDSSKGSPTNPETSTTSSSANPTSTTSSSAVNQASNSSTASPKLLTSMPNSRAKIGGAGPSGLKNSSNELRGRGSPGLRNAVLASSGVGVGGRSGSPGGIGSTSNPHSTSLGSSNNNVSSGSLAPWATVKNPSNQSSSNPTNSFNSNLLSDFPTAAEVVRAKKLHEERLAHHAAEEAARQEKTLQDLERFRGNILSQSGSGTQWDELEDGEEDDFLDGVVEFADGTKYEISNALEDSHQEGQKREETKEKELHEEEPQVEVTKEERFKDVSHDRSWPPNQGQNQELHSQPQQSQNQKKATSFQPSTILSSTTKKQAPSSTTSRPPWGNLNTSTTSSGRDLPPHAQSSNAPLSPQEENHSNRRQSFGRSSGWDNRSGERSGGFNGEDSGRRMSSSGNRSGVRPFSSNQPQATPSQAAPTPATAAPTSARAWGTLAQRQALLNPDAPKPTPPSTTTAIRTPQSSTTTSIPQAQPQSSSAKGRDLPPHALMTSGGSAPTSTSTSAAQITSPVTATSRPAPITNPWTNRKHGVSASSGPLSPSTSTATAAPTLTIPSATTLDASKPSSATVSEAVQPNNASSVKSPTASSSALSPTLNDPQRSDMLTAAERARRRREEEEKTRAAEKERARKKAAEIEERMRKEKEEKEKIEKERKLEEERIEKEKLEKERQQREKERKDAEDRKITEQQKKQSENDVWKRGSAHPLPPQSLVRNQKRTTSSQAIDELSSRTEQARQALSGKIPLKSGARDSIQPVSTPSQIELPSPSQVRPAIISPSTEATSWRRAGPLPSSTVSESKVERGSNATSAPAQSRIDATEVATQQKTPTATTTSQVPTSNISTPTTSPQVEVQKQILPRQVPRSPTITAPSPTQPQSQPQTQIRSSPSTSRTQIAPTSPSKSLSNLDDLMMRIKGAMSAQSSAQASSASATVSASVSSPSLTIPTGPSNSRILSQTPQIIQRPTTAATAAQKEESKEKSQSSSQPQQQPPVQPAKPPARPEPQTTRAEVPMDPPPVWNKFAVKIKKSESSTTTKGKGSSSKRVRIEVPDAPDVAPVYPLTWDPPIHALSTKTLSRDAQFFPKAFHKGHVIASVSLPKKVLEKNSVQPRVKSQPQVPVSTPLSPSAETPKKKESEVDLPKGLPKGPRAVSAIASTAPKLVPTSSSTPSPMPKVNIPKPSVKLPTPASTPDANANQPVRVKGSSNEANWRQNSRTATTSLETPPNSNPPIAPAAMRSSQHPSSSPSPAPASRAKLVSPTTSSSQQAATLSPPIASKSEVRSPFKAAVSAAVSQAITATINPSPLPATSKAQNPISAATTTSSALPNASKAPGSSRQQNKVRRESAVAFHPSMGDLGNRRDTSSPVSFMVNSELESSKQEVGVGSSALSGLPVSVSGRSSSATQTPASNTSVLPSPSSLGGSATWGFPVLDRGTPLLPDSDHLKSVWALSPSANSSREVQNSLKGIADDFLPSSIPLSVHDLNGEEGSMDREVSTANPSAGPSDISGKKGTASPNSAAPGRFDAGTNTDSVISEHQRSQSHSPQQPVGARNGFGTSNTNSPSSSPFQQGRNNGLPQIPVSAVSNGSGNGTELTGHSNSFNPSSSQQFSSKPRRPNFNQGPYPYGAPNVFTPYPTGSPYLSPGGAVPAPIPQPQPPFGGYSPFAVGPAPYPAIGANYSPFGQPQRLPLKHNNPSALGINNQGQPNWGNGNGFGSNQPSGSGGLGMSMSPNNGHLQHQSPQLRNSGLNVRSPAFTPSFSQNQSQNQSQQNSNSRQSNNSNGGNGRAAPPHMFQQGGW